MPALDGRLHVDGVVAGAGPHDQREPPRVEHRLGDLRRPHDEHVGAGPADRRGERVVLQVGLEDDLAPGRLQTLDARSARTCRRRGLSCVSILGPRLRASPLDEVSEQAVPQLRLEPGRLGRHDPARIGDAHQVGHADRDTSRTRRPPCPRPRAARARPCRGCRRRSRSACRCAGSPTPSSGASTWSCSRLTSSGARPRPPRRPAPQSSAYQRPPRYIETSPLLRRAGRARPPPRTWPAASARNAVRRVAVQVLHHAVVRQDLRLVVRERHREDPVRLGVRDAGLLLREERARPRRARRPVVPVGDVEAGQRGERRDQRVAVGRPSRARSCGGRSSAASKSNSGAADGDARRDGVHPADAR